MTIKFLFCVYSIFSIFVEFFLTPLWPWKSRKMLNYHLNPPPFWNETLSQKFPQKFWGLKNAGQNKENMHQKVSIFDRFYKVSRLRESRSQNAYNGNAFLYILNTNLKKCTSQIHRNFTKQIHDLLQAKTWKNTCAQNINIFFQKSY